MSVSDDAIVAAQQSVASREGVLLCPEGAATYAANQLARRDGRIGAEDRVVLFNCATGLKYPMPQAAATFSANDPNPYRRFK